MSDAVFKGVALFREAQHRQETQTHFIIQADLLHGAFERALARSGAEQDEMGHYSLDEGNLFWIVAETLKEYRK